MLQLTTSLLFLLGTIYGDPTYVIQKQEMHKSESRNGVEEIVFVNQPLTLEEYVRLYYNDAPILAEIARCESRFRHIGPDGKVIRGEASQEDIGVMQINEFYHGERAEKLRLNLHTLDGNLAYAKWLYDKEGPAPWFASSRCWQRQNTLALAEIGKTEN